jgi:hypothetical protein
MRGENDFSLRRLKVAHVELKGAARALHDQFHPTREIEGASNRQ